METLYDTEQYEALNKILSNLRTENDRIIKTAKLKRFVSIAERENMLINIVEQLVHKVRRLETMEPPEPPVPSQPPSSGEMTKS